MKALNWGGKSCQAFLNPQSYPQLLWTTVEKSKI